MSDTGKQLMLSLDDDDDFFELYVKDGNQEFVRHVRFVKVSSLDDAEDVFLEAIPDYWKTMSVRPVEFDYVWKTYTDLHMSYMFCKSILGLL